MTVEFEDSRAKIMGAIDDAITAWLYECGGELQARIMRNSRVDLGQTKGSYTYHVDINKQQCQVGSPLENAIWEEYGTGEYALNGNGRKGGWYVHESQLSQKAKSRLRVAHSKNGQKFYFTKGKTPNRPIQNAIDSTKEALKRRLALLTVQKIEAITDD